MGVQQCQADLAVCGVIVGCCFLYLSWGENGFFSSIRAGNHLTAVPAEGKIAWKKGGSAMETTTTHHCPNPDCKAKEISPKAILCLRCQWEECVVLFQLVFLRTPPFVIVHIAGIIKNPSNLGRWGCRLSPAPDKRPGLVPPPSAFSSSPRPTASRPISSERDGDPTMCWTSERWKVVRGRRHYTGVTFSAHGPFEYEVPCKSLSGRHTGHRNRRLERSMTERNRSFFPAVVMNPKPLSGTFLLMTPSAICEFLVSVVSEASVAEWSPRAGFNTGPASGTKPV